MEQWTLTLTLKSSLGESYQVSIPTDAFMGGQYWISQSPPSPSDLDGLEGCVRKLRIRELRHDILKQNCLLLGEKLAQTMQDAEGWHDASRIEPSKRLLQGKDFRDVEET